MTSLSRFLSLGAIFASAVSLPAAVIYEDNFSLADSTSPVQPNTALNWYSYNSGNNATITGSALVSNPGANAFRGVVGTFSSAITLAVGDSLRFDFTATLTNGPTSGGNTAGFRFGLSNSNTTAITANTSNSTDNDFGYFARVAYQGITSPVAATTDIAEETGASGAVLGGTDVTALTGSGTQTAVVGTTAKTFGFLVTRTSATSVTLSLFQDGEVAAFYTATDSSGAYFTFDEVAIGTGNITSIISLDNVTVNYTSAVPEPSAFAALAGAAVLGLSVMRRRRQS